MLVERKIIWMSGFSVIISLFIVSATASDHIKDHGDGTVTDTNTGLMWAAKDNGIPINWQNSLLYCLEYNGGSNNDWRMATIAELKSLYDPGAYNQRDYHVTKPIEISAQSLWAPETRGFEAARFNFTYGKVFWLRQTYSGPTRILPVRSGK